MEDFPLEETKSQSCVPVLHMENTGEEVWTMICYSVALSRPIICQFRTVHFLVNILVSGKISIILLCLITRAACQVRSENRNNWWAAPPPPLLCRGMICRGWIVDEEKEGLGFNEVLDRISSSSIYLSLIFYRAPPPQGDNKSAGGQSQDWEGKEEKGQACEWSLSLIYWL